MKLNVTKEEFIKIYLENSNREACKKLHICDNTLWRYAKTLGLIGKKRRGRPETEIIFKES